jgi:cell division protein FtsI (penicillin-binding protein 3)
MPRVDGRTRRAAERRKRALAGTAELHDWQSRRIAAWGRVMILAVVLAMTAVLARVVELKMRPDPRLAAAVGSPMSSRNDLARRGDLLDRRGRIIGTSTRGHRLFVDPTLVEDPFTIAVDLAEVIEADPIAIDKALSTAPMRSRYVVVDQLLEPWQAEAVRRANLRGVGLDPRLVRHYPGGETTARLVGRVGFEHTGLSGMEQRYNEALIPSAGHLAYLRDVRRRPLWINPGDYQPAADGDDVRLSIDLVIQEIAEQRLARAVEEQNAGGGRIIVMDPRTGEILAMHDVLRKREGWDEQTEDPLRAIDPALGRNRCVTDPYEPGSTFKPFIWSIATELGRARLDEVLPTPEGPPGHRTSYGRIIRDSHYYGPSTWRRVLVKSMNSGMAIVAERMSHDEMQGAIVAFGFGEETHCGVPGESCGLVTRTRDWSKYTQCSVAMGHEIGVTPVQMVRAFSAFARDGTIPNLRLVATRGNEDYQFIRRAIPESIALLVREVMREVMLEGTGRRAQSSKYRLFGKSGTAQLPKKDGGGYHEDRYVSGFIAGAPFEQPRVVVLCVIDDPDRSKGHWGGAIAGPVVRDVIDATLEYLGVPPDKPQVEGATVSTSFDQP